MNTTKTTRSLCANALRALSMDAVQKAKSGHPGAPMGMAVGRPRPFCPVQRPRFHADLQPAAPHRL